MQNSKSRIHFGPGFTLLEVMISVAVVAIALMAVLGSQSRGISLAGESRFKRAASLLAQAKMAEIEAIGDPEDLAPGTGDFGEEFPGYTYQWSAGDVSLEGFGGTLSDHLKRIDLEVTYGSNQLYRYRLRLYRYFP